MRKKLVICLILILILSLSGCSKGNPTVFSPDVTNDDNIPSILIENADISNHNLAGIWSIQIDTDFREAKIIEKRDAAIHYNVTQIIPAPQIMINGYEPSTNILDVDVTITNPYPVDVFDVRLIIFTDSVGHKLFNDDGWTSLFDIPSGLPINPFKAYAKDILNRKFTGNTQHTENLQILLPNGNTNVTFGIDASYPDNCEEPFEIADFTQGTLYDTGGASTTCQIMVNDHQADVSSVKLYCPEVTGTSLVSFHYTGSYSWEIDLINNIEATEGEYNGFIIASSLNSGALALYDNVLITVSHFTGYGWARTFGGSKWERGACITTDNQGNVYVSGYFSELVDFDPGTGIDLHNSNGSEDIFLCKYDNDSNYLWSKTWGGMTKDNTESWFYMDEEFISRGLSIDIEGNIFVGGNFRYIADFDPGPGVFEKTATGGSDCFILKLDSNGNFIDVKTWGGSQYSDYPIESVCDLCLDEQNNVFLTGAFTDTCDFNPEGEGVDFRTVYGNKASDIFLAKYDENLRYQWVKTWGGDSACIEKGYGIAIDSSNNIYITGNFSGQGDLDPGINILWGEASGSRVPFLSKFDSNGELIYANLWGDSGTGTGRDVTVDVYGNVYFGGEYTGQIDFDPGPNEYYLISAGWTDAFLSKLSQDGEFKWVLTWHENPNDTSLHTSCYEVVCFNDFIYVASRFLGNADFDPGPGEDWHYSVGTQNEDIAICKFSVDGNYFWTRTFGSVTPTDCLDQVMSIAVDNEGNTFSTGYFSGLVDFNPGIEEEWHYSVDDQDVFLLKLRPNGYWE
jgi:hypothetical protein